MLDLGSDVHIADNFSRGTRKNIKEYEEDIEIYQLDLTKLEKAVFHLAALPSVRVGIHNPDAQWRRNAVATYNLLKQIKEVAIPYVIFSSSSTVYGMPNQLPTSEDHPLQPISVYGATKVTCESLLSGFAHTFDIRGLAFRFANIMGDRVNHGVVYDFVHKLKETPSTLDTTHSRGWSTEAREKEKTNF